MRTLAIDPGNVESAYVLIEDDYQPVVFGKLPNDDLLDLIYDEANDWSPGVICIEMVSSYGMAVGAEVFETCVWIGRFQQTLIMEASHGVIGVQLIKRDPIKLHHCRSPKAKDTNVVQALVDRFAPGQTNYGKGTKAKPGWFYGFSADVWQAYALAVYAADRVSALAEGIVV